MSNVPRYVPWILGKGPSAIALISIILLSACGQYGGVAAGGVAQGFRSTLYYPHYYPDYSTGIYGYDSGGTSFNAYPNALGGYTVYDSEGNSGTFYPSPW